MKNDMEVGADALIRPPLAPIRLKNAPVIEGQSAMTAPTGAEVDIIRVDEGIDPYKWDANRRTKPGAAKSGTKGGRGGPPLRGDTEHGEKRSDGRTLCFAHFPAYPQQKSHETVDTQFSSW